MNVLMPALSSIVMSMPLILIWVIGIVLALSRWRRHPRVSLFAIIAFSVFIVSVIVVSILTARATTAMMSSPNLSVNETIPVLGIIVIIQQLISAVAWAFILGAIFGWRDHREKKNYFPPAATAFSDWPREQNAPHGFSEQ
jgi:hypothetical protein